MRRVRSPRSVLKTPYCKNVPVFALFRESGKKVAGKGAMYRVRSFNYGLIVPGEGMTGAIGMLYDAQPLSSHAGGAASGDSARCRPLKSG